MTAPEPAKLSSAPSPSPTPTAPVPGPPVDLWPGVPAGALARALGVDLSALEVAIAAIGADAGSIGADAPLDLETAELLVLELGQGREARVKAAPASASASARARDADASSSGSLRCRVPVVCVMGHVDHGKTTLLDAVRRSAAGSGQQAVAGTEAGGITQRLGAFLVHTPSAADSGDDTPSWTTWLDTPGHAAFASVRRRGGTAADVAVIVVAADDGPRPQTIEATRAAREAGCQIVVALTKCDLPGADPDGALERLEAECDVACDVLGGTVPSVRLRLPEGAATDPKQSGVDALERAVAAAGANANLRANPAAPCRALVVDVRTVRGRGAVAVVVVRDGALREGAAVVAGSRWGRARGVMVVGVVGTGRDNDRVVRPGEPAELGGLDGAPEPGDWLVELPSDDAARRLAEARSRRAGAAAGDVPGTASSSCSQASIKLPVLIPTVLRAANGGLLEALRGVLATAQGNGDIVRFQVQSEGLGPVTRADLAPFELLSESDAASAVPPIVVGLGVRADRDAQAGLERVRRTGGGALFDDVVYRLEDQLGVAVRDRAPEARVRGRIGWARVGRTFLAGRDGRVAAGCRVLGGRLLAPLRKGCAESADGPANPDPSLPTGAERWRVLRGGTEVLSMAATGGDEVRAGRNVVSEAPEGTECGVSLNGFDGWIDGDTIECWGLHVARLDPSKPAAEQGLLGKGGGLGSLSLS